MIIEIQNLGIVVEVEMFYLKKTGTSFGHGLIAPLMWIQRPLPTA